jgi:hypothetical protein
VTDRHTKPRITIRAEPEQIAAWRAAANRAGADLNTFVGTALDSLVESSMTARLRINKLHATIRRRAADFVPCDDPHCSQPLGHNGRCDFLRDPQ